MRITSSSSNQKRFRGRSKQEYLRQVRKLGENYAWRELAGVTEREVFDYLVHRREVEKLRPSTLNQAVVALRMFYRDYLGKKWALWERFEIRRDRPLPVVLTRGETRQLLGSVRSGRFRAVLALLPAGSVYLGHASLTSTLVYLHVTEISESRGRDVQSSSCDKCSKASARLDFAEVLCEHWPRYVEEASGPISRGWAAVEVTWELT